MSAGNAAGKAPSGRAEWRAYWTLPLAAALGTTATSLVGMSFGVFIEPLQAAFDWSIADAASGVPLLSLGLISSLLTVGVGLLVDRFGPRWVGITGAALVATAYGLLATATGTRTDWLLHWLLIGFFIPLVSPLIWASAVASRFEASRGLAFFAIQAGTGFAAAFIPVLAGLANQALGFRMAFVAVAAVWAVVVLPLLLLWFRGANDGAERRTRLGDTGRPAGVTVRQALAHGAFYKLLFVNFATVLILSGLLGRMLPILIEGGIGGTTATVLLSLIGIGAFIGKLGAAILLDRTRPERIGAASFLILTMGCLLLLLPPSGLAVQGLALALIGLAAGSQALTILYLVARHFGLRSFGTLYGLMLALEILGNDWSPLLIGTMRAQTGSYSAFYLLAVILTPIAGLLLLTLGSPRQDEGGPSS